MSSVGNRIEQAKRIKEKLAREFGPAVSRWLTEPDVLDILLNPDGTLWVERLGRPAEQAGHMSAEQAEAVITTIAAATGAVVTSENPLLECEVPFDGSRFAALIPPIVSAPCFAIRRKAGKILRLDDYVSAGVMTRRQADQLAEAIEARRNIVVAGGTGSGKTTLANALIAHMAEAMPEDRLIVIEDTPEIQCAAPNALVMRATASVSLVRLVRASMRLSPKRIIVGEVRGGEALELIKAWNTGHPGGIATVHANSAKDGLIRLEDLVREATAAPMRQTIGAAVHFVLFIAKTDQGQRRKVEELVRVSGVEHGEYVTNIEE